MAKAKIQKKYLSGLSESTAAKRKAAFRKRIEGKQTGAARFKEVPGDPKGETRPSRYTLSLGKMRDEISEAAGKMKGSQDERFVKAVATVTKIPKGIIQEVFDKGLAAWAVGHRPGATQEQWARARVYSFLSKGRTVETADKQLFERAKESLKKKGKRFSF